MKSRNPIHLLLLCALIAYPLRAQEASKEDVSKCFVIDGTSDYYFGEIDQEGTVEHTFLFKNNCATVIEVENARASCGCTAAIVSDKVIQPGQQAKIEVKFTPPKGTRGKVTKTVSVYLKGETQPHTVLRFSATIKTDFDIEPQFLQLLGAEVGKPVKGKATVKNTTDQPLEFKEMNLTVSNYTDQTSTEGNATPPPPIVLKNVSVTPASFTLKPGESKDLTVTITPEAKGQLNGSLRIITSKSEGFLSMHGIVREASTGTGTTNHK